MAGRGRFLWVALLLWLIGMVGAFAAPMRDCCVSTVPASGPMRMACCLPPAGLSVIPACCRVMPHAILTPPVSPAVSAPAFALAALPVPPTAPTPALLVLSRLPEARAVWTEPPSGPHGPRGPPLVS